MRLDILKRNLIAHRGLFDNKYIYENTIEAFAQAIDKNYHIELDVHLLKDNTIVVYHDDNLKRLAGINKKLKDITYKEIKNIKIGKNSHIPTLVEVLDLVKGKVTLLIELKSDYLGVKLEKEIVKILDNYQGKYAIQSFNPLTLLWFKKNRPSILRGLIMSSFKFKDLRQNVFKTSQRKIGKYLCKPDFLSFNVTSITIDKLLKKHKNKFLLGWTITNKEKYNKYKLYYDNLVCEGTWL